MSARWQALLLIGSILAAIVASFLYLEMDLGALARDDAPAQMATYVQSFFPPDTSAPWMRKIGWGLLETLAISAVGTLLATGAGALLSVLAAGRLGVLARVLARLVLNALRSVPELVWAALMVLAAGLGPFAGTLAIALHTTGVLGRLFAEALENSPGQAAQALQDSGSGAIAAFFYGTLPNVLPQWLAYSLYRWENNIRMAAVLGFVGAGGLGQLLYVTLSLFQQSRALSVILAMLLLVLAVDSLSAWLRRRLA